MGAILGVQLIASILQIALSARILGPDGYGVLALLIAITGLSFGLLSIPGHDAITTFVTRSVAAGKREEAAATLRFAILVPMGLALVSYAVVAAIAIVGDRLFELDRTYVTAILIYGMTGIFRATNRESLAVLRSADRLRLGVVISTVSSLTRIAVLAVGWVVGGGLLLVITSYVAGAAVNGVGMFLVGALSTNHVGVSGLFTSWSIRVPRDVIRFQIASFGRSTVESLVAQIDVVLISQLTSTTQLGLYRAARQLIETTRWPFLQVEAGVQVEYSKQWYGADGAAVRGLARRFTIFSVTVAVLGYGILLLFHGPLIRYLLGADFTDAGSPLLFLTPGAFAFASVTALHVLPRATGQGLPPLFALSVALVAQLLAVLALVSEHGASGAAWSYTAFYIVYLFAILPFALLTLRRSKQIGSIGAQS